MGEAGQDFVREIWEEIREWFGIVSDDIQDLVEEVGENNRLTEELVETIEELEEENQVLVAENEALKKEIKRLNRRW